MAKIIEKDREFEPVTLVLETIEEVEAVLGALAPTSDSWFRENPCKNVREQSTPEGRGRAAYMVLSPLVDWYRSLFPRDV